MDALKKKRPRGRAPHGRFNVEKIWNEETGEWDEDPQTLPPAQDDVEAAEEEAAPDATSTALTNLRERDPTVFMPCECKVAIHHSCLLRLFDNKCTICPVCRMLLG